MALGDLNGAIVTDCQTDVADKIVDFQPTDVHRRTVRGHINREGWTIREQEELEGGTFVSYFVSQK